MIALKKNLVLLSILVILIWGFIAYRIYKGIQPEDLTANVQPEFPKEFVMADTLTYTLKLAYSDPFLKGDEIEKPKVSRKKVSPLTQMKSTKKEVIINIDWTRLVYLGSIYNASRGYSIATVSLDGKEHHIKSGDVIDDFEIIMISEDSITVLCLGDRRNLTRKE